MRRDISSLGEEKGRVFVGQTCLLVPWGVRRVDRAPGTDGSNWGVTIELQPAPEGDGPGREPDAALRLELNTGLASRAF